MSSRKREKPYFSRHAPYFPKRRRRLPLDAAADDAIEASYLSTATSKAQTSVVVTGVPEECSVLDLKSRFEMYGPIARTRMEPNGVAYINFRSADAAQSAVDAALDSSFPITLNSIQVKVMKASDPIPQWERGIGWKEGLSSKLVRAGLPLSRHGRGNKLSSAIVNPRDDTKNTASDDNSKNDTKNNANDEKDKLLDVGAIGNTGLGEGSYKGREIVAYDDIL